MRTQRVDEQLSGRVNDDHDLSVLNALEHSLINIVGAGLGDTARENQRIAVLNAVELLHQLFESLRGDIGTLTVDLGLTAGLDLDIDTRKALFQADELGADTAVLDTVFDRVARKAGDKTEGGAVEVKLREHLGNVDTLTAVVELFGIGTVGHVGAHVGHADDIVDGRTECHGINHFFTSLTMVFSLYLLSGHVSVMIQPTFNGAKVAAQTLRNFV